MVGPERAVVVESVLPMLEAACHSWQSRQWAVRRRFNAELNVALVVEGANGPRPLTRDDLAGLALGEAQLVDRAFQNLHLRSARPFVLVTSGVYVSSFGGVYAAARLALPRILDGLHLNGDPVAFLPTRNTLIVTGSNDAHGLLEAFARVRHAQASGNERVTTAPLRRTEYGWESWLPEASSPARAALEQLLHEQLNHELSDGGALLAELLPSCSQPTIGTRASADGKRREVVVALSEADGSEVLVPRADEVVTASGTALTWEDFARQNSSALQQVEAASGAWFRLMPS
jgi:hypothetical protein